MSQASLSMQSSGLVSFLKSLVPMWVMRLLGLTGTKSTDFEESKADRYFKRICEYELEIEQINNQITELENQRVFLEERLSNATIIYSNLITK